MDPMVVKYLGLAAITYGMHAFLAIAQILLCVYLLASRIVHLSSREHLGKLAGCFGLVVNPAIREKQWLSWLMIGTGIAFILPLLGLSHWIAVAACAIATYSILAITSGLDDPKDRRSGNLTRKGLALSAILVFGFTIWEERDLVFVGFDVNYKTIY